MGSEASTGAKNYAVYCATKFGLRGLAHSLRADAAGSGVRVSLLNPGMVDTPFSMGCGLDLVKQKVSI